MSLGVFRVGPGYVNMWMHATTHWNLPDPDRAAAQDVGESMIRLVRQRTALEESWQASREARSGGPGAVERPRAQLAETRAAVRDLFEAYYFALSSFGSFLSRFPHEIGAVPHADEGPFLDFVAVRAPWVGETVPTLRAAWRIAVILDPYLWREPYECDLTDGEGRAPRVTLRGRGDAPPGASRSTDTAATAGVGDPWVFSAPDADLIVWSVAVQLNAFFPVIEHGRLDPGHADCTWVAELEEDEPLDGYPLFAIGSPSGSS